MPVISKLNYLRISPRKVRLVADLIRKKPVKEAEQILHFTVKKPAKPLAKLLKTAVSDAQHNFNLDAENLYISKIIVNEGPRYKRWRPRSRGMVHQILKRTSHVTIVLDEIKPTTKKKKKAEVKKEEKKSKEVLKTETPKAEKEKVEEKPKEEKRKQIPKEELEVKPKPSIIQKGIKRIFRRKAF